MSTTALGKLLTCNDERITKLEIPTTINSSSSSSSVTREMLASVIVNILLSEHKREFAQKIMRENEVRAFK